MGSVCVGNNLGLEKAALAVQLLLQTFDFFIFHLGKKVQEEQVLHKKCIPALTLTFSVFTSIMAEYCTPAQADYHYETKVTANVCRS